MVSALIGRTAVALIAAGLSFPAAAQSVTDGDTIKVNGSIYRLWGIDAPEKTQVCADGWPAGRHATSELQSLIQGRQIICERKARDRYGRTVAICRAGGEDLGAIMVREGLALAFLRYTNAYVQEEQIARSARLGVHSHECQAPWDWRAEQRIK